MLKRFVLYMVTIMIVSVMCILGNTPSNANSPFWIKLDESRYPEVTTYNAVPDDYSLDIDLVKFEGTGELENTEKN